MPVADAYRYGVNKRLKDPAWRALAFEALSVLDGNPQLFVNLDDGQQARIPFKDVYCQGGRELAVHFEDLVLAAIRWQHVLNGTLIYRFIQVGGEPCRDADVEGNRGLLRGMVDEYRARNLYGLLDADFWGGRQGEDGFVEFERPFIVDFYGRCVDENGASSAPAPSEPLDGTCTRFPLEVGSCMPDQLEMHLQQCGCFARFPYNHDFVVFMELTRRSDPWSV